MLYVTRLELQNIRRFPTLVVKFNEPGCCAVLVGDNGDGKSTVLRSLAMGLCDQSSAAALFRELSGEFVRHDSLGDSFVQVDLAGEGGWQYRIHTKFIALDPFERIEQTHFRGRGSDSFEPIDQDAFPWSKIFVSGYGPGIRTFGNADYSYYLAVDAVYSLFRYDAALQSPELVIRRLVDAARGRSWKRGQRTLARLREVLAELLHLKDANAIDLNRRGISVTGTWGEEELAALGDGYRATTTWTLDLMSWWLLHDEEPAHGFNAADLVGIVIIDELEQHLHPRWQRTILPDLRELFPKIQFIVATHSPLVASSCEDVAVHRLQNGEHTIHAPFGWRAEDVYDMMGLPTSRADPFTERLARFEKLDRKRLKKRLSKKDKAELRTIELELRDLPGTDPVRLMLRLHNLSDYLKTGRGKSA
jgi:AAA domain, putative AbiEii toxin, Type IV TA system